MKGTPVNIETANTVEALLAPLGFRYHATPLDVENTGHVIEVPYETGSYLRAGPSLLDQYQLVQFHFHAPSEHTIDGKSYAAELHLVHANTLGDLAVVGVLLDAQPDGNPALDQVITNAPNGVTTSTFEGVSVNARSLLPHDRSYFAYTGSLTTPPCTESVRWFVMTHPVPLSNFSADYLHLLNSMFPGYEGYRNNNRPVAPLNGRKILLVH